MGLLFETIITELNLGEAYQKAQTEYSSHVAELISSIGFIDKGESLDSSLSNPLKFMKVTDALFEHLNAKIDDSNSDTILSLLLDTEVISADSFLPNLSVTSSVSPDMVEVSYGGCILPLSLFVDGTTYDDPEDLMTADPQLRYAGRILVHSNSDTLQWCPYEEAHVAESNIVEEPTIPEPTAADARIDERKRARLEG